MGVRKGNVTLAREIDRALQRERPAIAEILARYRVPIVAEQR